MNDDLPLSWNEYLKQDATALAGLVRTGQITAQELARQAAAAATRVNPKINAVIETFDDVIRQPAGGGMDASGPFHGVPMLLKDLGSKMKGRKQESGYAWTQDNIADTDDPLTSDLRRAGFNLMGRTTTPEDGMAGVTESIRFGITRNPWDLQRSSGGSSGGSAAAVAAGIVPACSASDGAGSTRIPASWTGLVGLKPTRGRLPLPVGVHEALMPAAVEGVVTRTVRDTAAIYDAITHKPLGGGFMPYPDCDSLLDELQAPPRRFRIALSTGNWSRGDTVPPEYRQRVEELALWLEGEGHSVEAVEEEDICQFEQVFASYKVANWVAPLGTAIPAMAEHFGVELSEKNTSPQALKLIEAARAIELQDYLDALAVNAATTRQWGDFWSKGYQLLLCPTLGDRCPPIQSQQYALSSSLSFDEQFNHTMDLCRYTLPANDAGLPAISLPAGLDINGLPMGVQFYAPWTRETDLLHMAAQLERGRCEWFGQIPPVNVATG